MLAAYVGERTNRRHKPGRAFERTGYRFDVLADYGAFRDLQRHRMLTIEWQALTPKHGYEVPDSVEEAGERDAFVQAMERSAALHGAMAFRFPEQASYAVSLAYRLRFVMQMNAREAMHLIELRTTPQGHPAYRHVAQEMHRLIAEEAGHRALAAAMSFADHEVYELERLSSERAAETRRAARRDGPRASVTLRARIEIFLRSCDLRRRAAPQVRAPRATSHRLTGHGLGLASYALRLLLRRRSRPLADTRWADPDCAGDSRGLGVQETK